MQSVYVVKEYADQNEGKGPQVVVAMFSNEAAAEQLKEELKKKGDIDVEAWHERIYDTYDEFVAMSMETLREFALSKLSRKERQVLGLA